MSIQDMTPADLAAVMNNDDSGFGGNGWWIILLFLFLGWGNRGYGGDAGYAAPTATLYPWLNQTEAILGGFNGVQQAICGGFANAETAATTRQMADMQQEFALSQQLSQCCCENRLATANLNSTILSENCADRAALADGIREIIANQTANVQRILDKMCDQDLYAERRENEALRTQINMLNLAASQNAQTAQLIAELKTTSAAA